MLRSTFRPRRRWLATIATAGRCNSGRCPVRESAQHGGYLESIDQEVPNDSAPMAELADLRARYQQKWAEAAEDLAKAIELKPDDFTSWHHRTMLLVKLQQKDLLSEHLTKMLAKVQGNSLALGGQSTIHSLTTFPTGKPELIQAGEALADELPDNAWNRFFLLRCATVPTSTSKPKRPSLGGGRVAAIPDDRCGRMARSVADFSCALCHDRSQAEPSGRGHRVAFQGKRGIQEGNA